MAEENTDIKEKQNTQTPQTPKERNNALYENPRVYGSRKDTFAGGHVTDKNEKGLFSKKGTDSVKANYRMLSVVVMAILMLLVVLAFVAVLFPPEKRKGFEPTPTSAPVKSHKLADGTYILYGVVLYTNSEEKTVTVYDVQNNLTYDLPYTGASKFYAEAGTQITASVLKTADLLVFTVVSDEDLTIREAKWPEEISVLTKVDKPEIDTEINQLKYKDKYYKFDSRVCVLKDGQRITIADLNIASERYTIRYNPKEKIIYEIIVFDKPVSGEESETTSKPTPTPTPFVVDFGVKFNKCSIKDMGFSLEEGKTVQIVGPVGAKVYLNTRFVGSVPCEFEKVIGNMDIDLVYEVEREGVLVGQSKTYYYTGSADGKDLVFDFSDRFK